VKFQKRREVIRAAIEVRDMWVREAGALYTRFDCGCPKGTHTICDLKRAVDDLRGFRP
jgi:hypothetical protein